MTNKKQPKELGHEVAYLRRRIAQLQLDEAQIQEMALDLDWEREFLKSVIELNPLGIQILDSNGHHLMENRAFRSFFGKVPQAETYETDLEEKVEVFPEKTDVIENRQTIYLFMIVPLAITALFSILLCIFPNLFNIYDLAQTAVKNTFGGM